MDSHLRLIFPNSSKKQEGILIANSFYKASITLTLKLDKDITRNEIINQYPYEYRCQNLQQNTSKQNLTAC